MVVPMRKHEEEEDDGEIPILPNDTMAALQDFYSERDKRQHQFDELKARIEHNPLQHLSMEMFSEDWNSSQFWYNDNTATLLARQLLKDATAATRIAIVSAPSSFIQLKNLVVSGSYGTPQIALLEFDDRFNVFGEFVHYDFNSPLRLPSEMKGAFDRILCDPPFLSADCQTKAAMTVRWLLRTESTVPSNNLMEPRLIICTGEMMEGLIVKLYPGVRATTYEPKHNQDRLSNSFRCFANFACDDWGWRQ